MLWDKKYIFVFVIIILHVVGVIGISIESTKNLVLSLSFINLTIGFLLLVFSVNNEKKGLLIFLAIAFIIGYLSELIGVHSGLLFGDYWYGKNLGPKIAEVPVIIGINWGILAITSAAITELYKFNKWSKVFLNSLLMVLFDFVMEPVAMKSDFWSWKDDVVPIYNYFCWFIIAFIIQVIYLNLFNIKLNIVFRALFIIQFVFFLILYLL